MRFLAILVCLQITAPCFCQKGGGRGSSGSGGSVHVNGYYRKDGTYVQSYNRNPPGSGSSFSGSGYSGSSGNGSSSSSGSTSTSSSSSSKPAHKSVKYYGKVALSSSDIGKYFQIGKAGLYQSKQPTAIELFTSHKHASDYTEYLGKHEKQKVDDMISEKKVIFYEVGTSVKLLNMPKSDGPVEVKLLEGPHKEKSFFVNQDNICLVSEREEENDPKDPTSKISWKDEEKAAELLTHANRWFSEGENELALRRVEELLRRFPDSKAAIEAKQLKQQIEKK